MTNANSAVKPTLAQAWHLLDDAAPSIVLLFNTGEFIQLMKDTIVHITPLDGCGFGAACRRTW